MQIHKFNENKGDINLSARYWWDYLNDYFHILKEDDSDFTYGVNYGDKRQHGFVISDYYRPVHDKNASSIVFLVSIGVKYEDTKYDTIRVKVEGDKEGSLIFYKGESRMIKLAGMVSRIKTIMEGYDFDVYYTFEKPYEASIIFYRDDLVPDDWNESAKKDDIIAP